jgi:hypothetical protein
MAMVRSHAMPPKKRPQPSDDETKPVLAWIHGGGNSIGHGGSYSGAHLATDHNLLVVTFIHMPQGFAWTNRGYEYALMWGLILFAVALRGGGPYSLDRRIGREL